MTPPESECETEPDYDDEFEINDDTLLGQDPLYS